MEERRKRIALWVLSGVLALTFIVTGGSKIADVPPSPENFARWGYSPTFMHAVGAVEVLGGIALLVPALAAPAALALLCTMAGAVRTGLLHAEKLHVVVPGILIVLLAGVLYGRRAAIMRLLGRSANPSR
jgi:uncharacterized membrane protein YphA (DoxX/SURF4 family)